MEAQHTIPRHLCCLADAVVSVGFARSSFPNNGGEPPASQPRTPIPSSAPGRAGFRPRAGGEHVLGSRPGIGNALPRSLNLTWRCF